MSKNPSVLIVDDEPEIGALLGIFLGDDFDVTIFTDPREACAEITKRHYDLVISDIRMPFLSGLDVVKHVKSVRPGVFVVLITGHAQTVADKAEAIGLGASEVLFKPFGDPGKIIGLLQKLLEGQDPAAAAAAVAAAPVVSGQKSKPRVLAMDDDAGIVEILQLLLEDYYYLHTFTDPMEALACFAVQKFDVIIIDLNMPTMSGKEAILRIRQLNASIPIIVMTGHGRSEPEALEALAAGGNDIMEKPFKSVEELVAQIGKLVE